MQPVIAFDLDGTLVDTAPDLLATLDLVMAAEGLSGVPRELGRRMIGHGAKVMIENGLRYHGRPANEERLDQMFARFLEHYRANIAVSSRPFPGAVAALDRLHDAGVGLVVCTNKLESLARQLLDALGMTRRFAAIVGPDTLGVRKPDPAHVVGAIELGGGDPRHAVMIGDSTLDVAAAKGAGVPAIAVDFGYSEVPATQLGADEVISHFDQLWGALAPRLGLEDAGGAARRISAA